MAKLMSDKSAKRGKMRKVILAMTAASFLCFAGMGSALADRLELVSAGSNAPYGVYTGPYQISIGTSPPSSLICDDYATEIGVGKVWTATANPGSDFGAMKFTSGFYEGVSAAQAYKEMFWLSEQMMKQVQQGHTNAVAAISYAIWSIPDPTGTPSETTGTRLSDSSANWLAWASEPKNYGSVNLADFVVYTPNAATPSQEFIRVVPIPPSLLLLAPGLLGLVGMRKRFKVL